MRFLKQFRQRLLCVVGLIALAIAVNVLVQPLQSGIRQLATDLWELATAGGLFVDLWHTSRRFAIGYVIAVVTAVPLGILVGRVGTFAAILDTPIELLRPIPSAVVIPLGIAFLGIGEPMKVFVVSFGAFWPLLVVTRQAAKHIDPVLLDVARVYHVSSPRAVHNRAPCQPAEYPWRCQGSDGNRPSASCNGRNDSRRRSHGPGVLHH